MNKFKKILLGALSVLTLGLFVVAGAKVNAATVTNYKITASDFYGGAAPTKTYSDGFTDGSNKTAATVTDLSATKKVMYHSLLLQPKQP